MQPILRKLVQDIHLTGAVRQDMTTFLAHHGYPKTAVHCAAVAAEASRLARLYGADTNAAETAALLHDISAVFPNAARVEAATALGIPLLPAERQAPMIIHQKISAAMAASLFGITDAAVLSAIGCHTTLKAKASLLDKVLFVADKIRWDQPGRPPYLAALETAVSQGIDQAAYCYLNYLWQRRHTLQVVHPWFVAAYQELTQTGS